MKTRESIIRVQACIFLLLSFFFAFTSQASTVYTYTGNDYNQCAGIYCIGGPYSLSIEFETTLTGNALANITFQAITPTVTTFEFTDGTGLTVDQNTLGGYGKFEISTDASGNIVTWLVGGYANSANVQMQTNWDSLYGFIRGADFSETTAGFAGDFGFVAQNPGAWMKTESPVPIPAAVWLFGSGLLGLAVIRKKSIQREDLK